MTGTSTKVRIPDSPDYVALEQIINNRIAHNKEKMFQTDATGLYDFYLLNLPEAERQHYNCRSCRKFFDDYGGIVTIDPVGIRRPLFLYYASTIPEYFANAMRACEAIIRKAKVICEFFNSQPVWGRPITGAWTHLSCHRAPAVNQNEQKCIELMAESKEEYGMLRRALKFYPKKVATAALAFLQSDTLDRSSKAVGIAQWFVQVHQNEKNTDLIWRMLADAPAGYAHVNNTMIATLMDDLLENKNHETIKRNWASKMNPLQYQRPTAPLNTQNIAKAEKIVQEMGIAPSLERRFAQITDVRKFIWIPTPTNKQPGGVFGHLKTDKVLKDGTPVLPPSTMTWVKFCDRVLPTAKTIDIQVPQSGSFYGLVAPVNPDAPPIIRWPNQVTWYVYVSGSHAHTWNLGGNAFVPLQGIFGNPATWDGYDNEEQKVFFNIAAAKDLSYKGGALFFPELLRSEMHPVRSVLEEYSKSGVIQGVDQGNANGLVCSPGRPWGIRLRVKTGETVCDYNIDRFD